MSEKNRIEQHLKSAVDTLTPNVLDRIDLGTPQEVAPVIYYQKGGFNRRLRAMVLTAAACLCVLAMGGGTYQYHRLNRVIESVIGLDVNPSIELSINRKNKVLTADALNEEAETILGDMDLSGVDVNVAVNAVVGSMVTNGYFTEGDNAILVTVTNDSISKASQLRSSLVQDIELTLEENQVQAVVYDQQVIEDAEIKQLAEQYHISYGKAYFLKELIDQNPELSMDDMEQFSAMTMEAIAAAIADSSYQLGEFAEQQEKPTKPTEATTESQTTTQPPTETAASSEAESTTAAAESTTAETTTVTPTTEAETTEEVKADRVEIDYVDYEDGSVYVYFVTKVKWKNPTVSVFDENRDSFAAMISDTSSSECVIEVSGLEGGKSYTFVLGGLYPVEGGGATTVTGYFDKPMIADELETDDDDDETTATTAESTTAAESESQTKPTEESKTEPSTEETTEKETTAQAESKENRSTEATTSETTKEPA